MACLVLPVGVRRTSAAKPSFIVTVAAGPFDRRDTVVTFRLPKELQGRKVALRDEAGKLLDLQIDEGDQASFVLAKLPANAARSYRLEAGKGGPSIAAKGVEVKRDGNRLAISANGHPVIGYQAAGELPRPDIKPIFTRGGYIHAVYTPSGRVISDDYPANHLHHHGVWFAWTKTAFEGRHPDFWNMGDGTGTVEFVALDKTWSGPVQAGLKARNRYVDLKAPQPKTVLNEEWQVRVYAGGQGEKPYTMFDLISTQQCATSEPLVLPEYHYGGVGFRGRGNWDGKEHATFLTSEGKDRSNGHATRARWCAIGGLVDGQSAGIAILCHPENFRAPQPMRIHPDEPFFCYAPSQLGDWKIAPGQLYVSRYRFVAFDGTPDKAQLERLWNDYANPVEVRVSLR
jgi:hypothetical protein